MAYVEKRTKEELSAKNRQGYLKRRSRLLSSGLCLMCGLVEPEEGAKICPGCLIKESVRKKLRKAKLEEQKALQPKKMSTEPCVGCGKAKVKDRFKRCGACRQRKVSADKSARESPICCRCKSPKEVGRHYCPPCTEEKNRLDREGQQAKKEKVFLAYGGYVCRSCGCSDPRALQIDHVNNDGHEHRKQIRGTTLYQWLISHNYPEGFQILCASCNWVKRVTKCNPHVTPWAESLGTFTGFVPTFNHVGNFDLSSFHDSQPENDHYLLCAPVDPSPTPCGIQTGMEEAV